MSADDPGSPYRPRVLVVDDHEPTRLALQALLDGPDRDVVTVGSGSAALRELLRAEFAVVLLDVRMPGGLDGFETAKLIRGRERTRDTPIIFVTGQASDVEQIEAAYETGAVDMVWKPIQPGIVRQKVNVFVELQEKNLTVQSMAAELERSRDNLAVALESADGLIVVDCARRLLYSNPAADALFARHDPEAPLPDGVSPSPGRQDVELEDGRVVELNTVEVDWGGPALLSTVRDMTYRKHMEAELTLRNEELETLFRVIGHDLSAPLRHVQNLSDMVLADYGDLLPPDGRELLEKVHESGERLHRLLADLVVLAQARATRTGAGCDPKDVLEGVLSDLQLQIESSGARVEVRELPERLPLDRRWARQVLSNLIGNALKYTKDDASPEVEVDAWSDQAQVGLVVRDRGPGVPENLREGIFQLFRRGTTEKSGTGAGLAIVRQVAKRYGGSAWVEPRQGGGSEFVVAFGAQKASNGVS